MMPPLLTEAKLDKLLAGRCHDLAQFGHAAPARAPAQLRRRAAEKTSEARREMAVAGKAGLERDGGQIAAVLDNGIEARSKALAQHIVIDRDAGHLPKDVAEMKRRQVR